ncbi:MAG: hypothetical protein U0T77_08520 [Chitinophagales bacterium]
MKKNDIHIIFKSPHLPFKIFIWGLAKKMIFPFFILIILPVFNSNIISDKIYIYCIVIFVSLLFFQVIIQFNQKKTYVNSILTENEHIIICYNTLFKNGITEYKVLRKDNSLRLNVKESFFPIPTIGNSVSKLNSLLIILRL